MVTSKLLSHVPPNPSVSDSTAEVAVLSQNIFIEDLKLQILTFLVSRYGGVMDQYHTRAYQIKPYHYTFSRSNHIQSHPITS
jgi:hypothetical protein